MEENLNNKSITLSRAALELDVCVHVVLDWYKWMDDARFIKPDGLKLPPLVETTNATGRRCKGILAADIAMLETFRNSLKYGDMAAYHLTTGWGKYGKERRTRPADWKRKNAKKENIKMANNTKKASSKTEQPKQTTQKKIGTPMEKQAQAVKTFISAAQMADGFTSEVKDGENGEKIVTTIAITPDGNGKITRICTIGRSGGYKAIDPNSKGTGTLTGLKDVIKNGAERTGTAFVPKPKNK